MRVPGGVRDEEKEEEGGIKKGAIKKTKVQGRVQRRIWVRFIQSVSW